MPSCPRAKTCEPTEAQWEEGAERTTVDSESLKAKSVESPDETRTFDNGKVDIVSIDEVTADQRHPGARVALVRERRAHRGDG